MKRKNKLALILIGAALIIYLLILIPLNLFLSGSDPYTNAGLVCGTLVFPFIAALVSTYFVEKLKEYQAILVVVGIFFICSLITIGLNVIGNLSIS